MKKKATKGEIQHMLNNQKKPASGMTQDTINSIAAAAEHSRVTILNSVKAEIDALQEQLKGAIDMKAPEIPATLLTAIASIKADVTKKAWLGFFAVYHQYGIIPRMGAPVETKVEDAPTAAEFAKETAEKISNEVEEAQASDELAKAREKLVADKEKDDADEKK